MPQPQTRTHTGAACARHGPLYTCVPGTAQARSARPGSGVRLLAFWLEPTWPPASNTPCMAPAACRPVCHALCRRQQGSYGGMCCSATMLCVRDVAGLRHLPLVPKPRSGLSRTCTLQTSIAMHGGRPPTRPLPSSPTLWEAVGGVQQGRCFQAVVARRPAVPHKGVVRRHFLALHPQPPKHFAAEAGGATAARGPEHRREVMEAQCSAHVAVHRRSMYRMYGMYGQRAPERDRGNRLLVGGYTFGPPDLRQQGGVGRPAAQQQEMASYVLPGPYKAGGTTCVAAASALVPSGSVLFGRARRRAAPACTC